MQFKPCFELGEHLALRVTGSRAGLLRSSIFGHVRAVRSVGNTIVRSLLEHGFPQRVGYRCSSLASCTHSAHPYPPLWLRSLSRAPRCAILAGIVRSIFYCGAARYRVAMGMVGAFHSLEIHIPATFHYGVFSFGSGVCIRCRVALVYCSDHLAYGCGRPNPYQANGYPLRDNAFHD